MVFPPPITPRSPMASPWFTPRRLEAAQAVTKIRFLGQKWVPFFSIIFVSCWHRKSVINCP